MKPRFLNLIFGLCLFTLLPVLLYGQGNYLTFCNSFDSSQVALRIGPSSQWEIGQPTKTIFDSSRSGSNSIVTSLSLPYANNDTSFFEMVFKDEISGTGRIHEYLGLFAPLQIEFDHRFITASMNDFGKVEVSVNGGDTWHDVLSGKFNYTLGCNAFIEFPTYHYFEATGDTVCDSLSVFGDSGGWVHSKIWVDVGWIINRVDSVYYSDSIVAKFSFITDSIDNEEGWQIDNLCLYMDYVETSIETRTANSGMQVYPNPNNGAFIIRNENRIKAALTIYSVLGEVMYSNLLLGEPQEYISGSLRPGMYFILIENDAYKYGTKVIVE